MAVLPEAEIILPLEGLIDKRPSGPSSARPWPTSSGRSARSRPSWRNESFVARAPAEVVAQTRAKLAELESQRDAVQRLLQAG